MRYICIIIAALLMMDVSDAQVHINFRINIERQPVWGPAGYDYVEYYYLPDIEVYYYVPQHRFYYMERGRWIYGSSLPSRYRNYDLYNSYKVVVNEPTPYNNHMIFRDKYSSFKGHHDQQVIRDSRDTKYYVNENHPEHNSWLKQQKHEGRNEKGRGNKRVRD